MPPRYTLTLTLVALCASALAGSANAQNRTHDDRPGFAQHREGPAFRGPRGPGPGVHAGLSLERLDSDTDGRISQSEFLDSRLERVNSMFVKQDHDADGLISLEGRGQRERRPRARGPARDAVAACMPAATTTQEAGGNGANLSPGLARADLDGDGYLSLSELSTSLQARALTQFAGIDTDADGYLDSAELSAHHEQQQVAREALRSCLRARGATR